MGNLSVTKVAMYVTGAYLAWTLYRSIADQDADFVTNFKYYAMNPTATVGSTTTTG
jgi:hypothetical protein